MLMSLWYRQHGHTRWVELWRGHHDSCMTNKGVRIYSQGFSGDFIIVRKGLNPNVQRYPVNAAC